MLCVFDQGAKMNLPKYNLSYNTHDLLKKLALNISKGKTV